ncbi:MAG: mechanosensitive ion channel [Pseudomonadales bacterium]
MSVFAPFSETLAGLAIGYRLLIILGIAGACHLLVLTSRRLSARLLAVPQHPQRRKWQSVLSLANSVLVFSLYFGAVGFALTEIGVPITAYLASASIIGIAVGFGSQGIVQDVVSGITTISTGLFDVGDMVDIGGQVGVVRHIGMRFVELENSFGARVQIPNRSIGNVINYPSGYVRCIADVTLAVDPQQRAAMAAQVVAMATGVYEQFPGILLTPPSVEGIFTTSHGRYYQRIKFRIWPQRGAPIEETFRLEVVQALKQFQPEYDEWMVAVYYEVEQRRAPQTVTKRERKG